MPRIYGTRKERVRRLYEKISEGPASPGIDLTEEQRAGYYKLWYETWIECELEYFIKEYKEVVEEESDGEK